MTGPVSAQPADSMFMIWERAAVSQASWVQLGPSVAGTRNPEPQADLGPDKGDHSLCWQLHAEYCPCSNIGAGLGSPLQGIYRGHSPWLGLFILFYKKQQLASSFTFLKSHPHLLAQGNTPAPPEPRRPPREAGKNPGPTPPPALNLQAALGLALSLTCSPGLFFPSKVILDVIAYSRW